MKRPSLSHWRAIILFGWPVLIAVDWFTTVTILAVGGTELNPVGRFVLQFGPSYFLVLKITHGLILIIAGLFIDHILHKLALIFERVPRASTVRGIWTLGFLAPVIWNTYQLIILCEFERSCLANLLLSSEA